MDKNSAFQFWSALFFVLFGKIPTFAETNLKMTQT
jgi:hypothetical protein